MKFLVKREYIDLEAPIYMTKDQCIKFKDFLKNNFDNVSFIDREEVDIERSQRKDVTRINFSLEEYVVMFSKGTFEEKMKKIRKINPNRPQWSVELKIGDFFPRFNKFKQEKGYKNVTKEIVKQFLEEAGLL